MTDMKSMAELFISGPTAHPTTLELTLFKAWINNEYSALPVDVIVTVKDVSPEQLRQHFSETGELLISRAYSEHPHLSEADNVRFRAVHDWHHISQGLDFDWAGEQQAYHAAAATADKRIHWLLRSEIVLQAAAALFSGTFHPQRFVMSPEMA